MLIYQVVQMQPLKTVYGRFPTTDAALFLFNSKISENSSRVLQVTDVNLSLVQILLKTSENSLWILPK